MPEFGTLGFPSPAPPIPPGVVLQYAGPTPPSGWLMCDGGTVSRQYYARLFAVIGTFYGAGDGYTTFNLPDLRGRVPVGAGQGSGLTNRALGSTGGEESHTLAIAELPTHNHGVTDPGHTHAQNPHNHGVTDPGHGHTQTTSSSNVVASGSNFLSPVGVTASLSTQSNTTGISTNNTTPTENSQTTGVSTQNTGSGSSHNVMQPFVALNHIIKA